MMRTAITGTGGIAGICHVPALRAQAHRAVIVAAVDVDASRAEAFAAEHGIPAVCTGTVWYRDDVPWRGTWESEGGGPTLGHDIHLMDLMLAVPGEWAEVRAMAGCLERDVQTADVSAALVRSENGAIAAVVDSVLSQREESCLRFDLADATVELWHLYGYSNADWTFTTRSSSVKCEPDDLPGSHTARLAAFRPDLGRSTMELVTALYKAAITGLPVRRGEIDAADPFYGSLNGGRPEVFR